MKPEGKAVHIFVPESWHDWLRDEAHRRRVSIAEIIREAMEASIADLPPRPKQDEGKKGGEFTYSRKRSPASRAMICADTHTP